MTVSDRDILAFFHEVVEIQRGRHALRASITTANETIANMERDRAALQSEYDALGCEDRIVSNRLAEMIRAEIDKAPTR